MQNFKTVSEISKQWGISHSRVCQLLLAGRLPGVTKLGNMWLIPRDIKDPRKKSGWRLGRKRK